VERLNENGGLLENSRSTFWAFVVSISLQGVVACLAETVSTRRIYSELKKLTG